MKVEHEPIFQPKKIVLETELEVSMMITILHSLQEPKHTIHCTETRNMAYDLLEALRKGK